MSLDNILGKPKFVFNVGNVYPIRLKDWDRFEQHMQVLMLSKKHIPIESDVEIPLLTRLILLQNEFIFDSLCEIFDIVTRTKSFEFRVDVDGYYFINDKSQIVNDGNYEELRKTILHQNIILEPKIFKSKLMQEWAEKALKARQKNAANVTLEDMITTVAALSGKDYSTLENYTIYQLKSEFNRWVKIKNFESKSNLYAHSFIDPNDVDIEFFAESLDLYKDPYEDIFKKKSNLNITKALGK